jgi:2-oxoisovalerate dehydrogenase E1 component
MTIITYGMGVYWATEASKQYNGQVEIIDLRTLNPLDWGTISESVKKHGRALVLTEEPLMNSFAESLAGRLNQHCFEHLDAPVKAYGALNLPAIGLNVIWEQAMLPNAKKVAVEIGTLLAY